MKSFNQFLKKTTSSPQIFTNANIHILWNNYTSRILKALWINKKDKRTPKLKRTNVTHKQRRNVVCRI